MSWGVKKRNFFAELNSDIEALERITSRYSIFQISQDEKKEFDAEMYLDYDISNFELIARRLSKGDNQEYNRLLNDVPISEVIKLFAIDAAMNYAEYKNAEQK
jgi:hypothetical protein